MTHFTERDGIAVLQIIVFFPCLAASLFLCFKQGLKAVTSCWRFLIILACLRLGGAICQIIMTTNHSRSVVVAKLTCDLLGIAPLTLACLGLMQRINNSAQRVPKMVFTGISIISLVGLGLGIFGATKAVDDGNVSTLLQAALGCFIACLGLTICILFFLTRYVSLLPASEKIILYSVHVCTPFLLVRMVYAAMGDFGSDPRFSLFDGDATVYLCMGVLMEIAVMVVCLAVGFKCPPPKEYESERKYEVQAV